MGNPSLVVGALSYAGQFNVTIVSDPSVCPDAVVFARGFEAALRTLTGSSTDDLRWAGAGSNRRPSGFQPDARTN
jgi:hypothetical protein